MEIYDLQRFPAGREYSGEYELHSLDSYDEKRLEAVGIDVAFYWYAIGSYCGAGQLLYRIDGKWGIHDMGHCSCYGPCEEINPSSALYERLDDIEHVCTQEACSEIAELVAMARAKLYK